MTIRKKTSTLIMSIGFVAMMTLFYAFKSNTLLEDTYEPQTKWENLKVLPQNITKDSLMYLMKGYESALSVDCAFCHAAKQEDPNKLNFASDEKLEKIIARGMITMTNEINTNYFQPYFPDPKPAQVHVANCVMCHRGAVNPEKYLAQMSSMYKTYDPNRDNRIEKEKEAMKKE